MRVPSPRRQRGATAMEYAILITLIALAIVAGVGTFGDNLNEFFNELGGLASAALS